MHLEISFRIWMCGGTLLTVPCSHVGHIFRDRSPYKWLPGVNVIRKNSVRVAEVWLDQYKELYYERINNDKVFSFSLNISVFIKFNLIEGRLWRRVGAYRITKAFELQVIRLVCGEYLSRLVDTLQFNIHRTCMYFS